MARRLALCSLALGLCLGGCSKKSAPPPVDAGAPKKAARPSPVAAPAPKPAPSPAPKAEVVPDVPPLPCVGSIGEKIGKETLTIAGRSWIREGHELRVTQEDGDDKAALGLFAEVRDGTPRTLENVTKLIALYKAAGVEALIVTGNVAQKRADIVAVLRALAASALPTFVMMGARESVGDFQAALTAVRAVHKNVFDLGQVRHVRGDDYELFSVPGSHDEYLTHRGGCVNKPADVEALAALVKTAKHPAILVAHTPPRGTERGSLDFAETGEHVGSEALAKLIKDAAIPFGVFGSVLEAGGLGVGADLATLVPAREEAERLYVNPGSASAFPWMLRAGSLSEGMGTILRIAGRKASYEVILARSLSEVPQPRRPDGGVTEDEAQDAAREAAGE